MSHTLFAVFLSPETLNELKKERIMKVLGFMPFMNDDVMISLTQESLQSSKEWSDKEVKILIDHYQGNLVLWDHRSKEYRDRDLRKLALQKLKAIKKLKEMFLFLFF